MTESRRCSFPFKSIGANDGSGPDVDQNTCVRHNGTEEFVCVTRFDADANTDAATVEANPGRWAWSVCNDGCFDNGREFLAHRLF